jgi:ferrochelatase
VKTGVLLTGFGGPDSIEAVGPFMCNLMGREPSDELVERVCGRYLAIGGSSPLNEIAAAIAVELESQLNEVGAPMPVVVGMRYWDPYIADALAALKSMGCERVITVSLSPFESKVAHGAYREAISEAAEQLGGVEIVEAPLVSTLDEFAAFFASSLAATLTELTPNEGAFVAFTAHSLPESDLVDDDPYVSGLQSTANSVAERLGLDPGAPGAGGEIAEGFSAFGTMAPPRPWALVYQSKGNRPGAWLGPDLDELIDALAEKGVPALVVCPIGFMTDHMETMYDLDIVSADRALLKEVEFARAPVPNQDEGLAAAIARMLVGLV